MIDNTALKQIPIHKVIVNNCVTECVIVCILLGISIVSVGLFYNCFAVYYSVAASDIEIIMLAVGSLSATQPTCMTCNDSSAHSGRNNRQIASAKVIHCFHYRIATDQQSTYCMHGEYKVSIIPCRPIGSVSRCISFLVRANRYSAVLRQQGFQ